MAKTNNLLDLRAGQTIYVVIQGQMTPFYPVRAMVTNDPMPDMAESPFIDGWKVSRAYLREMAYFNGQNKVWFITTSRRRAISIARAANRALGI